MNVVIQNLISPSADSTRKNKVKVLSPDEIMQLSGSCADSDDEGDNDSISTTSETWFNNSVAFDDEEDEDLGANGNLSARYAAFNNSAIANMSAVPEAPRRDSLRRVSSLRIVTPSFAPASGFMKKSSSDNSLPDLVMSRIASCDQFVVQDDEMVGLEPKRNETFNLDADTSPVDLLKSILQDVHVDIEKLGRGGDYVKESTNGYTDLSVAARNGKLEKLQEAYGNGRSLQCCNRFGESIVHIVCRRGNVDLLNYMMLEAEVSIRVRDSQGRTPLHDAAWTTSPNFELFEILLADSPDLLFVKDIRGSYPLSFAPRQCWGNWNEFLEQHRDAIQEYAKSAC